MFRNPLIAPILSLLKSIDHPIKEYDLIQQLETSGIEFPVSEFSDVVLFKKHFLVMNALYHLQRELLEDELYLRIDPLCIEFVVQSSHEHNEIIDNAVDAKLGEYYLDWNHYDKTTQADVEALLNGFWKRYYAADKKLEALNVLQLNSISSIDDVKQAYRRLAALHHPDKGGDQEKFIEIREAYEILKCCV